MDLDIHSTYSLHATGMKFFRPSLLRFMFVVNLQNKHTATMHYSL